MKDLTGLACPSNLGVSAKYDRHSPDINGNVLMPDIEDSRGKDHHRFEGRCNI